MAATKRNLNWKSVAFTPSGGSATTITGVTSVNVSAGGSLLPFSGDGDHYVTTLVNDFNDWSVSITTADITASLVSGSGVAGSLAMVLSDAKNLTTPFAGQITFTLSNAMVETQDITGQHRQYGTSNLSFKSYSSDGTTSPMAIVTA